MQKLRIAAKAETTLLGIQGRKAARSVVLFAVALVFALLAISALNFGVFLALESSWGAIWAGVSVGAGDLLIAGLLSYAALSADSPTEVETLAKEVREMSYLSLGQDIDSARREIQGFVRDVRTLRSTIGAVTGTFLGPLSAVFDLFAKLDARGASDQGAADADPPSADAK